MSKTGIIVYNPRNLIPCLKFRGLYIENNEREFVKLRYTNYLKVGGILISLSPIAFASAAAGLLNGWGAIYGFTLFLTGLLLLMRGVVIRNKYHFGIGGNGILTIPTGEDFDMFSRRFGENLKSGIKTDRKREI